MTNNILFANNATSTLAAPITAAATTASLAPGTGALFPQITGDQFFLLTFLDALTQTVREIVQVTGLSGDTITAMVRGQEGTTPTAYLLGDYAQVLITAGALNTLVDDANAAYQGSFAFSALPSPAALNPGTQAFCTNGRNTGEAANDGTGCPVFVKAVSSTNTWCAVWSGMAVTI